MVLLCKNPEARIRMEKERTNPEERKGLTLADVGIPDYTEEQWDRLSLATQVREFAKINESDFSLDDKLPLGSAMLTPAINYTIEALLSKDKGLNAGEAWELRQKLNKRFWAEEELTLREFANRMKRKLRSHKGMFDSVTKNALWFGEFGPYFTNNFVCYFSDIQGAYSPSSPIGREVVKLIDEKWYSGPRDHASLWTFEGFRLTYPYYVALRRQGLFGMGS